jgi:hypothetical protein
MMIVFIKKNPILNVLAPGGMKPAGIIYIHTYSGVPLFFGPFGGRNSLKRSTAFSQY